MSEVVTPAVPAAAAPSAPAEPAAAPVTPAAPPANAAPAAASVVPPVTPVVPVVPESYPLALPDASVLASEALNRVTEKAKALKVTDPALAQAFVDVAHAEAAEVLRTYEAARQPDGTIYKALVAAQEKAALAHPELGAGDTRLLEQKALQGALVLNRFGPELAPVLKATGAANRPEVLLFLARLHDAMSERTLAQPSGGPAARPESYEDRMYGKKAPAPPS